MDILSILGIILSVTSITLAIVAIWFAWFSYKNSTEMQMKAQSILEQITQKVEVVVDKTSHQMDRAWDYITQKGDSRIDEQEETLFDIDKLKKEVIEETKNETIKIIKESGLDIEKVNLLESKVEAIVNRTTDKTEDLFKKEKMLEKYKLVDEELRIWYRRKRNWVFPHIIRLKDMISNEEIVSPLPKSVRDKLQEIIEVRNKIVHSKNIDIAELRRSIFIANDLLNFFRVI